MHIGHIVLAVGAFAVAACAGTETAALKDDGEHYVILKKHIMNLDGEEGRNHINIRIERDGEETIVIEGDADSPEVKEALAKLEAEGHMVHGDHKMMKLHKMDGEGLHEMSKDGEHNIFVMKMDGNEDAHHSEHKTWVMKSSEGGKEHITIDIDAEVSADGKHVIIRHGDKVETIVLPESGDGAHHVFIKKDEDSHEDGEGTKVKKRVIVIQGESEEEIREKLKELDLDIELNFDHEGDVEVEVETEVEVEVEIEE